MATKKAASKAKTTKVKKVVKAETKPKKSETSKKTIVKADVKSMFVDKVIKEVSRPDYLAALVVEFIATFLLVAGVITVAGQPGSIVFTMLAIVLFASRISGAHVNPLITLGAWATRRISSVKMIGYIFVQVMSSMLALSTLSAFISSAAKSAPEIAGAAPRAYELFKLRAIPEDHAMMILLAELIGAFIFSFIVASVTSAKKKSETSVGLGVAAGLYLALVVAGPMAEVLGGSVILNPAVAMGLQAFTNPAINFNWAASIYIGAALIGGVLGFALSSIIEKSTSDK